MVLSDYVNTFGQDLIRRYGERIHKITINAGFTCPNRDGTKGVGGCTFCNNASFNRSVNNTPSIIEQLENGRQVIAKRTKAKYFIAYFQTYTNTYADVEHLASLYEQVLAEPDVIGLSIGTRPDCVPESVLDLLAGYQNKGYEIWLELGLQSSFDETLQAINRGHNFAEYQQTVIAAKQRNIPICTHLIIGLPGENYQHYLTSLNKVLALGVAGLKLHPLHVVKHTILAKQWRQNLYQPLTMEDYVNIVVDLIERTPPNISYHRIIATASTDILLAPDWCSKKWLVLNAITQELHRRQTYQGKALN
ncbi:MAG: TIGR01212 family radical SAM protein [Thiomargarita sp.]|nr:TIGR01212 family radical SAM protein [Thiomargarita sp.]